MHSLNRLRSLSIPGSDRPESKTLLSIPSPRSGSHNSSANLPSLNVGDAYILKGDLSTAIEELKKVIELDPNFPVAHDFLGWAYLKQGREQEAIAHLQKGVEASGRASQELGFLGYGYGVLGKRAEAMAVLKELQEKRDRRESPAMFLAAVDAGLGEKDQAFAWLERDFQARTGLLTYITILPAFDTLRDDPRYASLLRRMGLRP